MALPILLIKILKSKYTWIILIILGTFSAGYMKGLMSERNRDLARHSKETQKQVEEIAKSEEAKGKLQIEHEKRINKIITHSINNDEYSGLLSNWPQETTTTR